MQKAILNIACKTVDKVKEVYGPLLSEFMSRYSVKLDMDPTFEIHEDGSVIILYVECRDAVEAQFLQSKFESILKEHDLYG